MKAGRKKQLITEREIEIMQRLWDNGPMRVRELRELYDEPKPHMNTLGTFLKILEEKGHIGREDTEAGLRFYAISRREDFSKPSFAELVKNYFSNSYKNAVSALVEDEKISVDELREIIDIIQSKNDKRS